MPNAAPAERALGLIECRSLTQGAVVADAVLKTARVHLLFATPVSPGKMLVGVEGDVADVEAAVQVGLDTAGDWLEDALFIPRLHREVGRALLAPVRGGRVEALGLVETGSVAAAIRGADASLKAASVRLLTIRLGHGIGGKAWYVVSGAVADATAAVEAGALAIRIGELLIHTAVIPQPHPDYARYLASGPGRQPGLPGVAAPRGGGETT